MRKNQTQEKDISLISANFGVKGWGILILTFLCIFLDSSLINDSLNVVIDVFANQHGWNSGMLYGFSTITAWIVSMSQLGDAFEVMKPGFYAPAIIGIGALLLVFAKSQKKKTIG